MMDALRASMRHGVPRVQAAVVRRSVRAFCAADSVAKQVAAAESKIDTFDPTSEVPDHMTAIRNAHSKAGADAPLARVLLADESEQAINNQINVEYTNCYVYHSMACYFSRDTVALHGFAAYFRDQSDDERRHAQLFMDFLSKRGGRVTLGALSAPPNVQDFSNDVQGDALQAMTMALALERLNFEKITALSEIAETHGDAQMADFIDDMLQEQAVEVKECADVVSQLRRIGKGFPVFDYDQYLLKKFACEAAAV